MMSLSDYIRHRAELAGLDLSDNNVAVIKRKWESDPLRRLDDLISGLVRLREPSATRVAIVSKRMALSGKAGTQ